MLFLTTLLALNLVAPQEPRFAELRRMVPDSVASMGRSFAVDINGDGACDLVTPQSNGADIHWNRGDGSFAELEGAGFPAGCNCVLQNLSFEDMDGDGFVDAIAHDTVHYGDGQGVFSSGPTIPTPSNAGFQLYHEVDDIDGDGNLDIYFAVPTGLDQLALYSALNTGARDFVRQPLQFIPLAFGGVSDPPKFSDLDMDGDLDLLLVQSSQVLRMLQDEQGTFVQDTRTLVGFGGLTLSGNLKDFDGDGDPDLVITSIHNGAGIYRNDGSGSFAFLSRQIGAPDFGIPFFLDLESDGDSDILFAGLPLLGGRSGSARLLLRNEGNFNFTDVSASLPQSRVLAAPSAIADFDADGFDDIYIQYITNSIGENAGVDLLLNDGSGAFSLANTHVPNSARDSVASVVGDFNGDGYLDLIAGAAGGNNGAVLWINDGAGAMQDRSSQLPMRLSNPNSIAAGDVDGDGDLDLFWPTIGQTKILINDGSAVFQGQTPSRLPVDLGSSVCAVLADLDGDGDLDAIIGNDSPIPRRIGAGEFDEVWINRGKGFFDFAGVLPNVGFTQSLAVADIDGDGDLDVFSGNVGMNFLYENDGLGSFTDISDQLTGEILFAHTQYVEFGDLNGDGAPDAFLSNRSISTDRGPLSNVDDQLAINDGNGVFTISSGAGLSIGLGQASKLGDVDGDGDLDVVVREGFAIVRNMPIRQPEVSVLLNDGAGNLTQEAAPIFSSGSGASDLSLVDLDGDGDLDLIADLRIFTNRTQSLSWRTRPRSGQHLVLELAGEPFKPYFLAGALENSPGEPTPFGNLRLLTPTIGYQAHGLLDASGALTLEIGVPTHVGLSGRTLYWQALVGDPLRLTNLEPTTFR